MKNLLLTLFLSLTLSGYCQSKFSVGLMGSLGVTGMYSSHYTPSFFSIPFNEKGIGYEVGVCARYQFTKAFSLQSGFSLVSYQVGSGNIKSYFPNPQGPSSYEYNYTYKVAQIPILCSFYFGKKIRFGFSLGPAFNHLYQIDQNEIQYFKDHSEVFSTNTYISAGFGAFFTGIIGVGAEYRFKKYLVKLEPTGTYQLSDFYAITESAKDHLWSIGLNFSAYYHF